MKKVDRTVPWAERSRPMLLVSVADFADAQEAVRGGADIVDVKNPAEGALGANYPWVISEIRHTFSDVELSATLGDLPYLPGTASLAAEGAASCGVQYVKVGLFGAKTVTEAEKMIRAIVRTVSGKGVKTVAVGYADHTVHGSISPLLLPKPASHAGAWAVMIDVKSKGEGSLLDEMPIHVLKRFVREAHSLGLRVGLAGGLRFGDLPLIFQTGADVVGFRRSACRVGECGRLLVSSELVQSLSEKLRLL